MKKLMINFFITNSPVLKQNFKTAKAVKEGPVKMYVGSGKRRNQHER